MSLHHHSNVNCLGNADVTQFVRKHQAKKPVRLGEAWLKWLLKISQLRGFKKPPHFSCRIHAACSFHLFFLRMSTVAFKQVNKYKHKEKMESDFELADLLLALKWFCFNTGLLVVPGYWLCAVIKSEDLQPFPIFYFLMLWFFFSLWYLCFCIGAKIFFYYSW